MTPDYFAELVEAVKVLTPDIGNATVMHGDSIRVYHGFHDTSQAVKAAKVGLSGKTKANRLYSYEANNNPEGLFVTTSLRNAREFVGAYESLCVIAEFHASESDLEIPVWPTGGFVGQGGYAEYWSNDPTERAAQRKEAQQKRIEEILDHARRQGLEWVLQSDRPDLAWYLQTGGENQALFIGDLNPNSIRAFWVREEDAERGYQLTTSPFRRISRYDFLRLVRTSHPHFDTRAEDTGPFSPKDEFDPQTMISWLSSRGATAKKDMLDTCISLSRAGRSAEEVLQHHLWPKQMPAARRWWAGLSESLFNRFHPLKRFRD